MKPDDRDAAVLGWWFAAEPRLPHGDGRAVVIGETLRVEPPLVMCWHALHLSEHPADALDYASGCLLYRVRGSEEILRQANKIGVSARTALAVRDATEMLLADARASALSVIGLWSPPAPAVVRDYLETGADELRVDAAWAAARAAGDAGAAAGAAAWAATDAGAAAGAACWAARDARDGAGAAQKAAVRAIARGGAGAAQEAAIQAHRQRLLDAVVELFGGATALAKIDGSFIE